MERSWPITYISSSTVENLKKHKLPKTDPKLSLSSLFRNSDSLDSKNIPRNLQFFFSNSPIRSEPICEKLSAIRIPEGMSYATEVQIWNNAAFDNGDSEDLTSNRTSWGSLKSTFENPKDSFDSVSDKENQGSFLENQNSSVSSSLVSSTTTPFNQINTDGTLEKSKNRVVSKKGDNGSKASIRNKTGKESRDDKKIDEEIKEIESEISRLSSRLEALRLEKIEISLRVSEKRGRFVPAKFLDQKQCAVAKNAEKKKNIDEISSTDAKSRNQRRGVSLGPSEIVSGVRRGMSMGPSEIFRSTKPMPFGKQEMITTPSQSRRKSCFLKLQEIDEEEVVEMGSVKGSSASPKSRKVAFRNQVLPRQAVTTIASKKAIKKEDGMISSIQPKKLFKEAENPVNKKPIKPGRVVASRYNQNNNSQASVVRKRSLPENDKDDAKRCEKKRSTSAEKSRVDTDEIKNTGTESRVKKKQWEIPSEIVVHKSLEGNEKSPCSMVVAPKLLPRIRIARIMNESPRDSGPAKRVAELTGKNSYFSNTDGEMQPSICQALDYADDDQES